MKRLFLSISLLSFILGSASIAPAQSTTGQISGQITDTTGAAIPGAKLTVTNVATGIVHASETDGAGNYRVGELKPGSYKLLVEETGFSSVLEQHIVVDVGQGLVLNIHLAAGSVNQTVEVEGNVPQLRATSAELGTVINEKAVHDLPLNGRNFTQLLTLTPGATPVSTSQGANLGADDGSSVALPGSAFTNPSVNGQQNRSTLYLLDGVVNTDFRTTTYTVLPIIDGIDEFKVVSHSDDPAYGSVLGGVVNLISKSGTNSLHGDAWEFLRNDFFDARDSFADATDPGPKPFRQNEFGLTVGGPIRVPKLYDGRDKTFFFFAYEGWRFKQPATSLYHSPTAAELSGDFSQSTNSTGIYDPATTTANTTSTGTTYSRSQFSYNGIANVINPARINTAIQTYLKTYLDTPNVPNAAPGAANTVIRVPVVNNNNSYQGRLDQALFKADSLFFRWSTMGVKVSSPTNNNITNGTVFNGVNIGGGYTHAFSPKLILDVRGGRASRPFTFVNTSSKGNAGLTGFASSLGAYGPPAINFDQFYAGAGLEGSQLRRNSSGSLFSSLNYQLGSHNLTAGGGFFIQFRTQLSSDQSYNFDVAQTGAPNAGSATSVQPNTGNALASALLGLPTQGTFQASDGYKDSITNWFGFVADSWKVNPKLTVNVGVRYDHLNQPNLKSGLNNGFDFANGLYYIGGGKLPPSCAVSLAAPCIPGPSNDAATNLANVIGNDGSIAGQHIVLDPNPIRGPNPVWSNIGPRVGFAWRARENVVLRGGFGIVFDDLSGISQTFSNSINNWPSVGNANPQYNSTFATPTTTVTQSQANIAAGLPSATPFNQGAYLFDPNFKVPYSEQYNLGIDTDLGKGYVLSVGYGGAASRRLDYGGVANNAKVPGNLSTIPYPYETHIDFDTSNARSNYNSLRVKFTHKFTNGLQFLTSYTFSKSIDDSSGRFGAENGPGGGSAIQDYYDPASNRAVSAYDIPHFFSFAGLYELPFGKGKPYLNSGLTARALGGWQVDTLAQLRSGQPYTLQVSGDVADIGDSQDTYGRPNYVGGVNPTPAKQTKTQWFNPAAFVAPSGTYGNVGRDSLRSSHVDNVDFSVLKNFIVTESASVQFRAEAFNVFNIINYGVPDSNISDGPGATGVITQSALPPRELQFALKVIF